MKSVWREDLTAIPYYQTVFFEVESEDGGTAYALGYVDIDGLYNLIADDDDIPQAESDKWYPVRWLDPTRV